MREIRLTSTEIGLAASVGIRRRLNGILKNCRPGNDAPGVWDLDIEGACGEVAAAKALGVYWPATVKLDERNLGDLPGGIEVRTRIAPPAGPPGSLILRSWDKPDRTFIFVSGRAPRFHVHGWIVARDGMRPEFWRDPGGRDGAYFIPPEHLHPLHELGAVLQELRGHTPRCQP